MFQKIKFVYLSILSILIGMKVTFKNLFAPSVTLDYPRKKQPMKANFRGMVDLKPPDCVICYQCIKICPTAALDLAHKQKIEAEKKVKEITKFTFNAELCCFCGLCEEVCPTDAIFLNKTYEVSTYSHEDILNIDLMKPDKYTHVVPYYNFEKEAKDFTEREEKETAQLAAAAAAAKAAAAPAAPAATATATAPAASPAASATATMPAPSPTPAPNVPKTETVNPTPGTAATPEKDTPNHSNPKPNP